MSSQTKKSTYSIQMASEIMGIGVDQFKNWSKEATEYVFRPRLKLNYLKNRLAKINSKVQLSQSELSTARKFGVALVAIGIGTLTTGSMAGITLPIFVGTFAFGVGLNHLDRSYRLSNKHINRIRDKTEAKIDRQREKLNRVTEQGLLHSTNLVLTQALPRLLRALNGQHSAKSEEMAAKRFVGVVEDILQTAWPKSQIYLDSSIDILNRLQEVHEKLNEAIRATHSNRTNSSQASQLLSSSYARLSGKLNELENRRNGIIDSGYTIPGFDELFGDHILGTRPDATRTISVDSTGTKITRTTEFPPIGKANEDPDREEQSTRKSGETQPNAVNVPPDTSRKSGSPRTTGDPFSRDSLTRNFEPPGE